MARIANWYIWISSDHSFHEIKLDFMIRNRIKRDTMKKSKIDVAMSEKADNVINIR